MTLPKFLFGMVLVLAIVAGWSAHDGASTGTVVLRLLLGALILQVGYFLYVLLLVQRARAPSRGQASAKPAEKPISAPESRLNN